MNNADLRNALVGTPFVVAIWFLVAPGVSPDDPVGSLVVRAAMVSLLSIIVLGSGNHVVRCWREGRYGSRRNQGDETDDPE
jgi:hypothetical protein